MPLNTRVAAYLKNLADGGDMMAKALVENTRDVKLSAAAEAANSITVTGQVTDGLGAPLAGSFEVLVKSKPVAGTGVLTDGGAGSVVAGSGTTEAWVLTDATGAFQVAVANLNAEANLIVAQVADGDTAMLRLTFA